ncbi:Rid family hydrolase [Bacteroidota bacterium]
MNEQRENNKEVRTRQNFSSGTIWEEIGRAHGEIFNKIKPASTMVEVSLIHPDLLVELEVTAVVLDQL